MDVAGKVEVNGLAGRWLYERYVEELAALLRKQYRRGADEAVRAMAHGEDCSYAPYAELPEAEQAAYRTEAVKVVALLDKLAQSFIGENRGRPD